MPQYKTATLEDEFGVDAKFENLDKQTRLDDEFGLSDLEIQSPSTDNSFEQLTAKATEFPVGSSMSLEDEFGLSSPTGQGGGQVDLEFGTETVTGATSIVSPSVDPTKNLDRPRLPAEVDVYEPDEEESQFLNSVDHQLNSIKANYYSLIGQDEEASKIMEASELENQDRGGFTGAAGGMLLGILPTAVASGLSLVAAPAVVGAASITALAYYVTSSMGQAQRELHEYEQKTGTDVPLHTEALKTIGYGVVTLGVEALGLGSMKMARAANPKLLTEIGEAFTKKEFRKAAKLMKDELPGIFHAAGRAEAAEEGIENTLHNLLTTTYDESRQIQDGLLTSLATGYGAGALLGTSLRGGAYFSGRAQDQAQIEINQFIDSQADLVNLELAQQDKILYGTDNKVQSSHIGKPTKPQVLEFNPDMQRFELQQLQKQKEWQQEIDNKLYSQEYDEDLGSRTTTDWEAEIAELQQLEYNFEGEGLLDPLAPMPDRNLDSPLFQSLNPSEQQVQEFDKIAQDLLTEQNDNIILASEDVMMAFRESKLRGLKVIAAKMQQPLKWLGKHLDVEMQLGGTVGTKVQNMKSIEVVYQELGMNKVKEIGKIIQNPDDRAKVSYMISIVANDSKYIESQRFKNMSEKDQAIVLQAAPIMRDYFEQNLTLIKERGISKKGFYEEEVDRILGKIEKAGKRERRQLISDLKRIKEDLSFVHIPYNLLMAENHLSQGPGLKKMQYLSQLARKTLTLQDIINPIYDHNGKKVFEGYGEPRVFSFDNVIASYAARLGKDVALVDIVDAGKADGRIISISKDNENNNGYEAGYIAPTGMMAKLLKGQQIDKTLANWLDDNYIKEYRPNKFVQVLNIAKHLSFLNPAFLFMYDIVQGLYGGSISYKTLFNGSMGKAWKSLQHLDEVTAGGLSHGMESSIMSDTHVNSIIKAVGYGHNDGTLGGKLRQFYHQYMIVNADLVNSGKSEKVKINPLKSIYTASSNAAWFLDSFVRRTSFYTLLDQGMSIKQAAEETALIHGKYASVPVKTRRLLNKLLYTPTFKIVMGKYFARMTRDIVKATKTYDDAGQRSLETAFRLFALMAAQSALMASLGFEEEEFGRKYTRQIKDTTGKPQQLNITWSAPHNMFFKYIYRFLNTSKDSRSNPLVQYLDANIWELNPVWRVGIQIWGQQRDPQTGERLSKPNRSDAKNLLAKINASALAIFPIYLKGASFAAGPLSELSTNDLDYVGDGMSKEEIDLVSKLTFLPYNFLYLSDQTSTKYISQMNSLNSQFQGLGKDYDVLKASILSDEDKNLYEKGLALERKEAIKIILEKRIKLGRKIEEHMNREKANRKRNSN